MLVLIIIINNYYAGWRLNEDDCSTFSGLMLASATCLIVKKLNPMKKVEPNVHCWLGKIWMKSMIILLVYLDLNSL